MSSDDRTAVDYAADQVQTEDRWTRSDKIEDLIEKCGRALGRGARKHYVYVAEALSGELIPLLGDHTGKQISEWATVVDGDWNYAAVRSFVDSNLSQTLLQDAESSLTYQNACRTIEATLDAVTEVAESADVVHDSYTSRADAVGVSLKLGEHLQDGKMDLGDPVGFWTDEQVDTLKWLVCGATGLGKSTGTEHFAQDYYQQNFREGRDYKVIDPLGFRQGENWLTDVPALDSDLRRIREEHDRPPSFAEADDLEQPQLEILHPLTRSLADEEFPYNVDTEEFIVRPFTIPASSFRKPVMVSLLMSRLSESEGATIREVYDDVDEQKSDWSLKDLADAIRRRDELSPKHKSKAIGVLRSLQNEGFIRTKDCPYTIDWDEIFADTDTYTVISQARVDRDLSALMTLAYLVDSIHRKREDMPFAAECVLVMRELWEAVPHKRRRSFDAREAAVQEALGHIFQKVFRQNRHGTLHILADTQEPNDLLKSIRERFNQYVVYSANRDTIDDIFEWTQNGRTRSFWATMTAQAGQAGVVGQCEPALNNRDIEFISPVEITPPAHKHFDVKSDGTGWHARAKIYTPTEECPECGETVERTDNRYYVRCGGCDEEFFDASGGETEELRRPAAVAGVEWPDEVPSELAIEGRTHEEEDTGPDPEVVPVQAFADRCLDRKPGVDLPKDKVYEAFNAFAKAHGHDHWDFDDHSTTLRFGNRLPDVGGSSVESKNLTSDGKKGYEDLVLTALGEKYLDSGPDVESVAEPIRGDD